MDDKHKEILEHIMLSALMKTEAAPYVVPVGHEAKVSLEKYDYGKLEALVLGDIVDYGMSDNIFFKTDPKAVAGGEYVEEYQENKTPNGMRQEPNPNKKPFSCEDRRRITKQKKLAKKQRKKNALHNRT